MLPAEKSKRPRWWKLWLRQFQLLMWKNWLLAVILFERIQNIHMLKVSISKSYRNEHLEPYLCRSALRWCLCFCCSLFKRWLWPIVRTPAMIEIMIAVGTMITVAAHYVIGIFSLFLPVSYSIQRGVGQIPRCTVGLSFG